MLRTCICPSTWAKALVHLIYKGKGSDPLDPRCYRPISLTSCISKVFERVILNRLTEEIDDKGILEEEQAGFRSGRSTRDQTYILRELLDSRKAAGQTTFLCFVDLTNAFPSTWQDGMWFRLQELGVKGRLYRCIRSMYRSSSSAIQTCTLWNHGLVYFRSWNSTRSRTVTISVLSAYLIISPHPS
jgi:hypothetical protein